MPTPAFKKPRATASGQPALLTFTRRFADVLELLCGELPSAQMCNDWLWSGGDELQEWALNRAKVGWVQGLGVTDAAYKMAELCEEGRSEFISAESEQLLRRLATGPFQVKFTRGMWRPANPSDKLHWEGVSCARSNGLVRLVTDVAKKTWLEHTHLTESFTESSW